VQALEILLQVLLILVHRHPVDPWARCTIASPACWKMRGRSLAR
jgi:hypothetical protein